MEETATESEWSLKAFFRSNKYGWRKAFFASSKVLRVLGGGPLPLAIAFLLNLAPSFSF